MEFFSPKADLNIYKNGQGICITLKTACKHEHIDYIAKYQDMTKEQVDNAIMPLLRAAEEVEQSPVRRGGFERLRD